MLSDLFQNGRAEKYLKQILFLAGVVGQFATLIITFTRYYEDQPFYVFLTTIISYIFVLIIGLAIVLKREKLTHDASGAKKTKDQRKFFYSLRFRFAIIIMVIIFTGISFLIVYKIVTEPIVKSSNPSHQGKNTFDLEQAINAKIIRVSFNYIDEKIRVVKDMPRDKNLYIGFNKIENKEDKKTTSSDPTYSFDLENYSQYEPRSLITAFMKIDDIWFVGKGAFAMVKENRKIQFARIIDPDKGDRIDAFYGDACAFKLYVRAINIADKDSVTIDAIIVNVISYETLPKYELKQFKPEGREVFYYVEIDDPKVSKTNLFKAQYFISKEKGKKNDFGSYEVEMGHREQVGIRVNARSPGIYKFECEILASHKGKKQKITLPEEYEFLFDK
jgi:hypothetical protein